MRPKSHWWALAKTLPKIYGDKIEVENKHVDGQGQPIDIVQVAKEPALEQQHQPSADEAASPKGQKQPI